MPAGRQGTLPKERVGHSWTRQGARGRERPASSAPGGVSSSGVSGKVRIQISRGSPHAPAPRLNLNAGLLPSPPPRPSHLRQFSHLQASLPYANGFPKLTVASQPPQGVPLYLGPLLGLLQPPVPAPSPALGLWGASLLQALSVPGPAASFFFPQQAQGSPAGIITRDPGPWFPE